MKTMEQWNLLHEFEKNQDRILDDLRGLIQIPSVAGEAEGPYPFGIEVQRALDYMLDLGRSMGFVVKNVDNYGGHIDFPGTEEGIIAIVGHIDVVPEGDGWTRDAFGGTVEDGWMFGRGTQDDKGPTIIGLYAMKLLKDLGFQPKKTIRLILGLDEEDSWDGMKYYLQHEVAPDYGIVPDADFPLVQCEKGLLQFALVKGHGGGADGDADGVAGGGSDSGTSSRGLQLVEVTGGSAPNVVAGQAIVRISSTEQELSEAKALLEQKAQGLGYSIQMEMQEEEAKTDGASKGRRELKLTVIGQPAHAAVPEKGLNAISMAMALLANLNFVNDGANQLLRFYNETLGFATDGSRIGCAMEDDLSGKLTYNVGLIHFGKEGIRLTMDVRYPVTKSKEAVYEGMKPYLTAAGYEVEEVDHIQAIYQESDHPVVVTLLEVYRELTGDSESQPIAMGGATFARALPNCMAFGPFFPGDLGLEHQKDEAVQISQLLKAGHIYAEAIYRLAKS